MGCIHLYFLKDDATYTYMTKRTPVTKSEVIGLMLLLVHVVLPPSSYCPHICCIPFIRTGMAVDPFYHHRTIKTDYSLNLFCKMFYFLKDTLLPLL